MSKYEKVKRYYEHGYWTKAQVRNAVVKGWITPEQYKEITEEDYSNSAA